MNKELEKEFIYRFIVAKKRERLLYELSGRKRRDGISRFCHHAADLIRQDTIVRSGDDLFEEEIFNIVKNYTNQNQAYLIAFQEELDQVSCDLPTALDQVLGNGMAAIILLDNVAIVETEQSRGTPYRYLLYQQG